MKINKKVTVIALALCISVMSSTLTFAKDIKKSKDAKFIVVMCDDPHPKDGEFPE